MFRRLVLTLDRRQTQLLRNLRVPNSTRLLQRHASHQLGQITRTRNRTSASKSLELDIGDGVIIRVDFDLQLHDISAGRGAHESCADICVILLHGTDIARVVVVVEDFLMV